MSGEGQRLLRISWTEGERVFTLTGAALTLGRAPTADIRLDIPVVSAQHARLVREGEEYRYEQIGRSNPTLFAGAPVTSRLLRPGDRLDIAPGTPSMVTITYEVAPSGFLDAELATTLPFREPGRRGLPRIAPDTKRLTLPSQGRLTIGRAPSSDIALPSLTVSRRHARIEIADGDVRLVDEGSANGTFVNGIAVTTRSLIEGDVIRIGPYKLLQADGAIEHQDDSRSVRLDAYDVAKVVGGRTLLSGVTFSARPGEVLAIAGTSGAGKSTLIDALNGIRPPTSGHVLVNGADLYRAYDALKPLIGYVPQETILPQHLTIERALHYVARMRLPSDVSGADADARIDDVIRTLHLETRRNVQIGRLSGGQQKRASIAAELIAQPGLLFLDEPTSGLDPGLTAHVTEILRQLAASDCTVVLISHDVESLQAADRIVFLASGGRVVFIGSPAEALTYFSAEHFADVYNIVEAGDADVLRERFIASAQYRERVAPTLIRAQPSARGEETPQPSWDPFAVIGAGARRGASSLRQFWLSTLRYVETMLADRRNLALLVLQAPIIAMFLAMVAQTGDLKPPPPEAVGPAAAMGISAARLAAALPLLLAATATWFGAINSAREIVKELPILRRERLAGLRVAPYLGSKVVVLLVLCVLQTAILLAVTALKVDLPGAGAAFWAPVEIWFTLLLASVAALALGLVISASVTNADRAQSLVPIALIPQLIFVGVPAQGGVAEWLSYLTITHWSVEAIRITCEIPYTEGASTYGASDLLLHWAALAGMASAFASLAAWLLARNRTA